MVCQLENWGQKLWRSLLALSLVFTKSVHSLPMADCLNIKKDMSNYYLSDANRWAFKIFLPMHCRSHNKTPCMLFFFISLESCSDYESASINLLSQKGSPATKSLRTPAIRVTTRCLPIRLWSFSRKQTQRKPKTLHHAIIIFWNRSTVVCVLTLHF